MRTPALDQQAKVPISSACGHDWIARTQRPCLTMRDRLVFGTRFSLRLHRRPGTAAPLLKSGPTTGLLALLLLPTCNSESRNGASEGPDAAAIAAAATADVSMPVDPAVLQARAKGLMSGILNDPASARYSGLRSGPAGSICGAVDSKGSDGRFGGPRPFVITPEGVALVSPTPHVPFDQPDDIFPDFYIRWCASPEELARLGPLIAGKQELAPAVPVESPDLVPLDPPGADLPSEAPVPPLPAQEPGPAQPNGKSVSQANAAPRPQSADDDSFFNAVLRKRDDKAAGK